MKCKELKIVVKQFSKRSMLVSCKMTVQIDGKKYISQLDLSPINHHIHTQELNELIKNLDLYGEMASILEKARTQMVDKKPFGIDTYWKWSTKA